MASPRDYPAAFWQYLLAAELSPLKTRALLEELASSSLDPIATLLAWPPLTSAEKARMGKADMNMMGKVLASGADLWISPDYRVENPEDFAPALFTRGDRSVLAGPCVAIVGTRKASTYGQAVATKFAEELGRSGVTIVSGGATGIDAAAHHGALQVGGATAVVLGGGIDRVYPAAHRDLFDRIAAGRGILISQYAIGTAPMDYTFRNRNFTIAALADAVIMIEVPEKSGALVTASAANDQNKPVLVVPGNITNPSFRGSHRLLRDGAILVDHPDHVLEALDLPVGAPAVGSAPTSLTQAAVLDALAGDVLSIEKLADRTGMNVADLLEELTMMEIEGLVLRDGIGYALKP